MCFNCASHLRRLIVYKKKTSSIDNVSSEFYVVTRNWETWKKKKKKRKEKNKKCVHACVCGRVCACVVCMRMRACMGKTFFTFTKYKCEKVCREHIFCRMVYGTRALNHEG